MDVAISLGLYISERNEGPFKDAFITFTSNNRHVIKKVLRPLKQSTKTRDPMKRLP